MQKTALSFWKNLPSSIAIKFLLVSTSLFLFGPSHAKKSFAPYQTVISMASVIVTGHISKVQGDSFYVFSVDQYVQGSCNKQIKVKLYSSWTCDNRWQKAAVGQQLFLCLTKMGIPMKQSMTLAELLKANIRAFFFQFHFSKFGPKNFYCSDFIF